MGLTVRAVVLECSLVLLQRSLVDSFKVAALERAPNVMLVLAEGGPAECERCRNAGEKKFPND
jgi:hypothetical protein